ncbi:MAG: hypothetical protein EA398_05170 [Deltaproteobacteria bacterium]|nr:MAG: hypothetical protein EA398_05170 [Deltaproteobacteria bacterium]
MATKRPAKLAIGKKAQQVKICPVTNKPMTAVKVLRKQGSGGMHWIVLEDFDGSDKAVSQIIPIR